MCNLFYKSNATLKLYTSSICKVNVYYLYKGSIYVLFSQACPSDLPIISKRLEAAGLQYRLLDAAQQAELLGEGAEIAHV